MIDRQQAEQLATVWARRDSQRLGYECRPSVDEFDLGYIIRSTVSGDVGALPGDLPTTVVDKETGEVTTWPRVPATAVERMYRRSRPAGDRAPRTVDPASQLLRELRRLPTPGTAAHLTVDGRTYVAHGAKGDVELNHHPLVRGYLDGVPAGHLVRGGDRHAELIVVSDVLHEYDHRRASAGEPPLTGGEARALFAASRLQVFQIREPGDRDGGEVRDLCESCTRALVAFEVLPWGELGRLVETPPLPRQVPDPDRFPPEVAQALADAGWDQNEFNWAMAEGAMAETCEVVGRSHSHEPFPAAERVFLDFPAILTFRRRPGRDVFVRQLDTNPTWAAHTADTLADFGQVLGARLFPVGRERRDSILAVDEHGRIFALDQAGEWFIGADVDTALTNLLLGHAPARVRDDGTW
ncbi:SUKH-3 domain-containing protein [Micromonospora sp. PLK6-60]|uniref:SUKH-3 domain-containing protein n=1 Tax=Micromonospora sp. PLK6-60 TaxID=2873383 RepID=UPI001CA61855|nr:SUKH-3 domain-containing protein [Micromonospora sp. PLK6-60]MBY8872199.1 SUKH-3 domain-containing protein [Micromonospora sp. PLK6-60]